MRFEYREPENIKEALSLLNEYGGRAKIIAGGTDLVAKMKSNVVAPEYVIDISNIPELDFIEGDDGQGLRIGAAVTIRNLEKAQVPTPLHPFISGAAGKLASVSIRNVGTLGGNLCNAAPLRRYRPDPVGTLGGSQNSRRRGREDGSTRGFLYRSRHDRTKGKRNGNGNPGSSSSGRKRWGLIIKHSIRGSIDLATVGVAAVLVV